jgi:nucleoside-diphosphate-sugar epimerase
MRNLREPFLSYHMKILITGATGFVGSYLVRNALAKGFETFAGVRQSSNVSQFKDLPTLTFIDLPYHHPSELKTYLLSCKEQYGTFDYIIHNAGLTKCQQKSDFDRVNYEYTKNFVEALQETNCIPQKFIYISSLSAVGKGDEDTFLPMRETDLPFPETLYGLSKLKAEKFLQSTTNFPYIIARPTGVYGPEDKEYNIYVSMIDKGLEVYLGKDPQYVSFIYISDLVKVLFTMLESSIEREVYFISDGESYTLQQYAGFIKKYLHKKTLMLTIPLYIVKALCYSFDTIGGWFGQVPTLNIDKYKIISARNWHCDISNLKQDFNFKPDYLLEEGVKETVAWYKQK